MTNDMRQIVDSELEELTQYDTIGYDKDTEENFETAFESVDRRNYGVDLDGVESLVNAAENLESVQQAEGGIPYSTEELAQVAFEGVTQYEDAFQDMLGEEVTETYLQNFKALGSAVIDSVITLYEADGDSMHNVIFEPSKESINFLRSDQAKYQTAIAGDSERGGLSNLAGFVHPRVKQKRQHEEAMGEMEEMIDDLSDN